MSETVPAAPGSLLERMRAKKAAKLEKLVFNYEVPHSDDNDGLGSTWLRFRPMDDRRAKRVSKKHTKAKDDEADLRYNASLIGEFCVGIYRKVNGEEVNVDPDDPDGEWPTFGSIAADENVNVIEVVRQVFVTDGSIHSCSQALSEWSDYRKAEEAETDLGE